MEDGRKPARDNVVIRRVIRVRIHQCGGGKSREHEPTEPVGDVVNTASITLSLEDVLRELKCLDITKGPGPDGIPGLILRKCAEGLAAPSTYLFNLSLKPRTFPEILKQSFITPIFKSGSKTSVTNYGPISILSTLPKIFDGLVNKKMSTQLRGLVIGEQHGFTAGRPTASNLMIYEDFEYAGKGWTGRRCILTSLRPLTHCLTRY